MDTTASSFTLRKNAKRAAEAMIRKGTAPAADYGIKPSGDGRFEIVWKSAKSASATDDVETEIAEASADQPAVASPTEDVFFFFFFFFLKIKFYVTARASGHRARLGIERAGIEKRMATRHPGDGAQGQIVA